MALIFAMVSIPGFMPVSKSLRISFMKLSISACGGKYPAYSHTYLIDLV